MLEEKNTVMHFDAFKLSLFLILLIFIYFFSFQLVKFSAKVAKAVGKRVGTFSTTREFRLQRHVYQHPKRLTSRYYMWVNEQLATLGLKQQGVTVMGYTIFWGFIAAIVGTLIGVVMQFGFIATILMWVLSYITLLMTTRVLVSSRIERRENDIMLAIELFVPEIQNGVMVTIVSHRDNIAESIRPEFESFIQNVEDRGYAFEPAMLILANDLGAIFQEFAKKACIYEREGNSESLELFTGIIELNHVRRNLRTLNRQAFFELRVQFMVSIGIVAGYFVFITTTDAFSRNFFFVNPFGKLVLIGLIVTVLGVLARLSMLKSSAL